MPEPYGTGALVLSARDPHWLYAHWDLSREAQRRYNSLSVDGHLVLRTCLLTAPNQPVAEMRVHPESQHWFVHVQSAGKGYISTLGYYDCGREWVEITRSSAVVTPTEAPSAEARVVFGTASGPALQSATPPWPNPQPTLSVPELGTHQDAAPREPALEPLVVAEPKVTKPLEESSARSSASEPPAERKPLTVDGVEHAEKDAAPPAAEPESVSAPVTSAPASAPGSEAAPAVATTVSPDTSSRTAPSNGSSLSLAPDNWTSRHEQALLELIYGLQAETAPEQNALPQPIVPGSAISSLAFAQQGPPQVPQESVQPWGGAPGISSPTGPERPNVEQSRGNFWMNINAELIIYGATEPTADVTLGGRQIRLRPDGSFSYRFALPDGHYELTVEAVSTSGDKRQARLGFARSTQTAGEVSVHPQDPGLKPPVPEGI